MPFSHSKASLAALTILLVFLMGKLNPAWARDCTTGVNVNSFQDFPVSEQDAIVRQLVSWKVQCVRTTLRLDDKNLHLAQELQANGIGLVLVPGFQFRPDAPIRPADPQSHMRSAHPLSQADEELSHAFYQSIFKSLDEKGIVLSGIELGNEINWVDFNGDFPVPGQGKSFSLDDLSHDPTAQNVARGFRQYLKLLAALKDARDSSQLNQKTPIIAAGMATVTGGAWQQKLHVDGVSIPVTYAYLRAHGLDQLVDGYGVHAYPPEIKPNDTSAARQRQALLDQQIFPPGNTKPYWLTEWGFPSTAQTSEDDQPRRRSVDEMRAYLDHLVKEKRLKSLFWYVWNDPSPCAIFRHGTLMQAGQQAIATQVQPAAPVVH